MARRGTFRPKKGPTAETRPAKTGRREEQSRVRRGTAEERGGRTGGRNENCFSVGISGEARPWGLGIRGKMKHGGGIKSALDSVAWTDSMVLCVAGFPAQRDAFVASPHSRVLVPPDRSPAKNAISLRYQPMTLVDPPGHAPPAPPLRKTSLTMASPRHKSPPGRAFRPKTAPGPRHTLEAIPNSWASASRPSDLRPNPPPPHPPRAPRPSPTPPPPPPAQPARLRSKSADRVPTKTSVGGPRSPKRGAALVQPTPKRLSLGMVMDTAKLVSAPPPSSDLGSSPVSLPSSKPLPTSNAVPIRSLPASPNGSPSIARLPISGSHYKRDLSPSPVHRSTSPALGPKPLPVPPLPSLQPPIPPSPRRPMLHLNPTVPLSSFTPSVPSWSPLQNSSPSTATTSYLSADSSPVKRDSPASTWSSGYFTSPSSPHNDRCRDAHQIFGTHASQKSIPTPSPSQPIEEVEEEEEEERDDYLDKFEAYDWTLEEELYDDQLFRIPGPESDDLLVEVFVDNLYCGELERSPSPITYARPAGGEFSDDDSNGGRRRRTRRRPNVEQEEEHATPRRVDYNKSATGNRRHSRRSDPSSPISYHSDDSSLYITGNRPLPSRRRRREQLRSYRYSFRPPVSPTAAAAATAVSLNTLAGFPRKVVRREKDLSGGLGCQRSPSPIEYARRRSLDGMYGFDDDEGVDEVVFAHPVPREGAGNEDALVSGWWEDGWRQKVVGGGAGTGGMKRRMVQPSSFMHAYSKPPDVTLFSEARERELEKERGRTMIPVSLGNYNQTGNTQGSNTNQNSNNKERSKEGKEKVRTRKGSRGFLDELAAVAVRNTYHYQHQQQASNRKTNNQHNINNINNNSGTPRTSGGSPPPPMVPTLSPLPFHSRDKDRDRGGEEKEKEKEKEKDKEKEKKRKWVWELSRSDGSTSKDKLVNGNGNASSSTLEGGSGEGDVLVLDIGNVGGNGNGSVGWLGDEEDEDEDEDEDDENELCGAGGWRGRQRKRQSLNGLEFV